MKNALLIRLQYLVMLSCLLLSTAIALAQTNTVTGKILDDTGQPAPGVSVLIKGSKSGTTSDQNGNFSLNVQDAKATLIVSFVGYASQEIALNNRKSVNITLAPDATSLGEAVVIGYGSQVKKVVTGAVQTINLKETRDIPVSQVTQKLQGRLPGVQINQTTGKPGQGMSVRIRGQLSVSAGSDPLYVVDGAPITGSVGAINPDEIETISILKDAAST